jgi:hypothetical protein
MTQNQQTPKLISYLMPSFINILWITVFFLVLLFGRTMMNADGDLMLHLSMGRYILDFGEIPLSDVFSHTLAGQPVAQHKWLSQMLFGFIERNIGLNGVVLLCALVIATTFWLVYKLLQREKFALIPTLAAISLAVVVSMVHWLIRPHVFTFLFLALWMLVLNQMVKGKTQLWWILPVSMIFWVNLHGGFIAGLVTWLLFGLGVGWDTFWGRANGLPPRFWRYFLVSGITAVFVTMLNPSGIGLWRMLITHLGNTYLASVTIEFQSPNFHHLRFWPFMFTIGLLVVVLGLTKKSVKSEYLFTSSVWLIMGLYSARNVPLFAVVSAPLIAQGLNDLFSDAATRFGIIKKLKQADCNLQYIDTQIKGFVFPMLSIFIVMVGMSLGFSFDIHGLGYGIDPDIFPVEAVDWLEQNPQEGEMFNEFVWGGYLQYRLWPEKRVFIDSNSDFYGEAFVRQYMQVINLQGGWEEVLDQYDVAWAILPHDMRAVSAIQNQLGWEVIYKDGTAVILRRE